VINKSLECGDSSTVGRTTSQSSDGGSTPTSSLHFIEIDKSKAIELVTKYHYLRRPCPIKWCWGIEVDGEILGVMTVGKPCSWSATCGVIGEKYKDMGTPLARSKDVFELNRLWVDDRLGRNTESRFIGWCLKKLKRLHPGIILISYADGAEGHVGYVYQATNWIYVGTSAAFKDLKLTGVSDHRSVSHKARGPLQAKCPGCALPMEKMEAADIFTCPCGFVWGSRISPRGARPWIDPATGGKASTFTRSIKHRYVWFSNPADKSLLHWSPQAYPKKAPEQGK
jgi:hypothetical protein